MAAKFALRLLALALLVDGSISLPILSQLSHPLLILRPPRGEKSASGAAALRVSHVPPPPLVRGFGEGLREDVSSRSKLYWSDIKDGLKLQTLSTVAFLFFACLAPALAFGGLMSGMSGGNIGTVEYLMSTGICGMVYAAFSGQPLTIIGSTGPVLAFTAVLYQFSLSMGLSFLPLYAWTGLWSSLFLLVGSFFSFSNVVARLTRFTDEIFSLLISFIFIFEAVKESWKLFAVARTPAAFNIASSSLILASSAFLTASSLSNLRSTKFFNKSLRDTISNFAPTIGVALAWFIGMQFKSNFGINLSGLDVPAALSTTSGRPWLIDLMELPLWARFASAVPAFMATILLFMDQNITVRLVNSDKHKLKKGHGYDLDLLIIALLTGGCSVIGFPWLVAATVRSLAHVRANTVYQSGTTNVQGVLEQRVTGFLIHLLIALSILFLRPTLATVPKCVMTGSEGLRHGRPLTVCRPLHVPRRLLAGRG